jgi:hypothetical protein
LHFSRLGPQGRDSEVHSERIRSALGLPAHPRPALVASFPVPDLHIDEVAEHGSSTSLSSNGESKMKTKSARSNIFCDPAMLNSFVPLPFAASF